jgi:23S rRNA (uracil1939-C5)-methyltransferase
LSKKYKVGEELDLKIEKIVPGGLGLGFAENLTVFAALSAPGDRLKVKIHQLKGKTAFAEIVEIIEPSVDRITPPCVYFGRCGGCDFQQLNYEAQLAAKIAIIKDCLARIGKINYEKEIRIIGSPKYFDNRQSARLQISLTRSMAR